MIIFVTEGHPVRGPTLIYENQGTTVGISYILGRFSLRLGEPPKKGFSPEDIFVRTASVLVIDSSFLEKLS